MLKLYLFIFLFLGGIATSSHENIDHEMKNNCVETSLAFDSPNLTISGDHNCQYAELTIWKVTYYSGGEWTCSSDGNIKCLPCIEDDEDQEEGGNG